MSKFLTGAIATGVIFGLGAVGALACTEAIPAGYVGVVYSMNGGVVGETLSSGWHLVSPTKKIVEFPISTESMYMSKDVTEGSEKDDSFAINSKDGKSVFVDCELSYRYDDERVTDVFNKFRGKSPSEIESTFIRARIKEVANQVSTQYAVLDIYGDKRTELNKEVFAQLSVKLDEVGIVLENFAFTRIEPDSKTMEAIQARVDAQQALEKEKIEAEKARIEAEKLLVQAKGEADAKRERAKGQADANELINASLSKELIDYNKVNKWDGAVSKVTGSGNVNTILSTEDLK